MSTATFDAIDMALLALIGVVTPLICLGGIGWAYRMEQRDADKRAANAGRDVIDRGARRAEVTNKSARITRDADAQGVPQRVSL
jgi:hypothetical protein